jgi:hypothetical protein
VLPVATAVLAFSCSSEQRLDGDHDASDADADSDTDGDTDTDSEPVCDEASIDFYQDPVRVMLLQDISSSMAGGNWTIAKTALGNLLAAFTDTSLEFGLDTFPDRVIGNCSTESAVVRDCGPDNEDLIVDDLNATSTIVSTPLYCALHAFIDPDYAPVFSDVTEDHYLVVVADGEDSCGMVCDGLAGWPTLNDFILLTDTLVALGTKVFVIGFGSNVSPDQLNAIASAGGTAFSTFLVATDEPSLTAAFDTIGSSVVSCTFTLEDPDATANPDQVNFYFSFPDDPIVYDPGCAAGTGWTWVDEEEHTQVELCEEPCNELKNHEHDEVIVTYGCDTIIE